MCSSARARAARSVHVRARAALGAAVCLGLATPAPAHGQPQGASAPAAESAPAAPPAESAAPASPPRSDEDRSAWGGEREINGHRFLSPAFVESALIVSYIGMRSNGELEETPSLPLENLGTVDIHQARIAESVDVQARVWKLLAVQLTLAGLASTATTSRSLVARGGDYRGVVQAGLLFKAFRLRRSGTQLSLRGAFGVERGHNITILPLIDALDDAPIRTAAQLINGKLSRLLVPPYRNVNWDFAVAVAQPFDREFAAQASADVLLEDIQFETYDVNQREPYDLDLNRVTPRVGVALTGDAMSIGVPLALMLEYRLSLPQLTNQRTDRSTSRTEHIFGGGLYYSGRADLQTGLVVYGQFGAEPVSGRDSEGDPKPSGRPSLIGARYMIRYFW
jgi:hypothetical protein